MIVCRVIKLSRTAPVLLLLILPLRAQTAPDHFTSASNSGAVWPVSLSQGTGLGQMTGGEQTADAGHSPVCTSGISLGSEEACPHNESASSSPNFKQQTVPAAVRQPIPDARTDPPTENVTSSAVIVQNHPRPDRNLDIYYRNRTEFSLEVGWHPKNIPFIYDFAVGDSYNMTPLKYTLVPIIASLRWHVTNVGWRWIFRGNMDFTFSGSITPIPRGPETHYYSLDFGIRRNFVYRNWKVVPYWEQRGGAGIINAKEPLGVLWAQGQNLTFTYSMGAGVRYSINSKYSFSGGMNYMHISNAYLSQPQFYNYGINVYGPMFGLNVRLGKPRHHDSE
jgi:hypothetical protein